MAIDEVKQELISRIDEYFSEIANQSKGKEEGYEGNFIGEY